MHRNSGRENVKNRFAIIPAMGNFLALSHLSGVFLKITVNIIALIFSNSKEYTTIL